MAGLLDLSSLVQPSSQGLLAMSPQEQDNARSMGLLALAAGMIKGDFGGGLAGFGQAYNGAQEQALKNKFMGLQAANLQSEVDTRKAALEKQNQLQKLLGDAFNPASAQTPMGQLGSGSFGVVTPPAGMPSIPQASSQPSASSRIGSMSPDMLALLKANGLDLVDVARLARPDMQVSNGYAYDKNSVRPGFMPQMNVANSGQVTQVQIGPDGQPIVNAPRGAVDVFSQYQNAEQAAKAKYDPIKVFNNATKQEEYVPRDQVAGVGAPQPEPGLKGNFTGDPVKIIAAISQISDPKERANAMAAFTEQAKRTSGFAQGAPFSAGPSQADNATAAANTAYQENVAKDVVGQRKTIMDAGMAAPQNIARYQQIGKLLSDVDGGTLTPTGTHIASFANSIGLKIDKSLPNKEAAASLANQMALELRSPAGGAGMPGAMSDQDRNFLVSMTPNQAQSAQGRKQIIDAYVSVQQRNQQVAQFARNYEKKYGKLDNGFFDQLSAWSSANSLFGRGQ